MNFKKVKKELPGTRENVSLRPYTTFKIGGPARLFCAAESKEDIIKALKTVKKHDLPFFVLGEGSNILVAESGFPGLVLRIKNKEIKREGNVLSVGAGAPLRKVVDFSCREGLSGLSWAAGIPGTVGGALRGNAAAFSGDMAGVVGAVEVFDAQTGEKRFLEAEDCEFGYKESIFKKNPELVILSAQFKLEEGGKEKIKERMEAHLAYRKKNHPLRHASAGCIFKNVEGEIKDKDLIKRYPLLREFNEKGIAPAGYLIEKVGLKGEKKGDAQISKEHANFILNKGEASAEDVFFLIKKAKKEVKKVFGVELEEEIKYLGFEGS